MGEEQQLRNLNLDGTWPDFRLRGLAPNPDGSLSLAPVPGFEQVWGAIPDLADTPAAAGGVHASTAGVIYLADPLQHRVLSLDTCTGTITPLPCLGRRGYAPGQLDTPRGLIVGPHEALYIADSGNHRIQVVDLRSGQIRGIWGQTWRCDQPQPGDRPGQLNQPWALAADQAGSVYIVEQAGRRVQKFSPDGQVQPEFWQKLSQPMQQGHLFLDTPTALAYAMVAEGERFFLLDNGSRQVLIFDTTGIIHGSFPLPADCRSPAGIAVAYGAIYIGDAGRGRIMQFDMQGRFVGIAQGYHGPIAGLGLAGDGSLLVYTGDGAGVVRLRPGKAYVTQGEFLAGPLEYGAGATEWHRLRLFAEPLTTDCHVQLFVHTSATRDKLELDHCTFADWQAVPPDELDALVLCQPARYLWIGGQLQGDGKRSPRLVQLQLSFSSDSYLRYLPAIYQEDQQARVLLERALSLFESAMDGLEGQVGDLPLLFDPAVAPTGWAPWLTGWQSAPEQPPPDWLPWLASWLAFDLDETWSEEKQRQAIADACELYSWRGTIGGLRRMLKLYAGVEALIEEPGRFNTPWSLGTSALGLDTQLALAAAQGAVVATTATLEGSHLIHDDDYGTPLFAGPAHCFCVWVNRAELKCERTLTAISELLERERPAHTTYRLCVIEPRMRVGFQARVGIDAIVAGPPPALRLDKGQPLGSETVLTDDEREAGGTVGRRARVGRSATLA